MVKFYHILLYFDYLNNTQIGNCTPIIFPATASAFVAAVAALAEKVIPSTDALKPLVVSSPFLQVLAYATILSSTFSICSANASALKDELLKTLLNSSKSASNSGVNSDFLLFEKNVSIIPS